MVTQLNKVKKRHYIPFKQRFPPFNIDLTYCHEGCGNPQTKNRWLYGSAASGQDKYSVYSVSWVTISPRKENVKASVISISTI